MACHYPILAWQNTNGELSWTRELRDSVSLQIGCGKCTGCRQAAALDWALRCTLESQGHQHSSFATLTYDDQHKPQTLKREHYAGFVKRLRARLSRSTPTRTIRHFGCGEYGGQTERPHYHLLLFGALAKEGRRAGDNALIQECWPYGHITNEPITPERIAYVTGYTWKPEQPHLAKKRECIDMATGEVYQWQPPFHQMSRRPGIGGKQRDQYINEWGKTHTHLHSSGGLPAPRDPLAVRVPKYFRDAWKKKATPQQLEQLKDQLSAHAQAGDAKATSWKEVYKQLEDLRTTAEAKLKQRAQRRNTL